jgi:hypothetical protein
MPPDSDSASETFGAWARARAGVSTAEQTKPEPTPEEARANAATGGADGGAGRGDDRGERPRDPDAVLREAIAIRRMRREL